MNMNAMLIRTTVLMVVALVLAFTATRQAPSAHAQGVVAQATVSAPANAAAPVELPTITVRPSAEDLIEAQVADETQIGGSGVLIDAAATDTFYQTLTPNMPSLRMDMPYYSFGKALRRGAKE
jgi:hypothetical protein